jgi:hypothetical protein
VIGGIPQSSGGGSHLWAERFDRDQADVFAVQDEVVARIAEALVGKLAARNYRNRKPPKRLEAYDLCVRRRFLFQRSMAEEGYILPGKITHSNRRMYEFQQA